MIVEAGQRWRSLGCCGGSWSSQLDPHTEAPFPCRWPAGKLVQALSRSGDAGLALGIPDTLVRLLDFGDVRRRRAL